ncbi:autotransporter domain-containing protein [Aminobacter sp. HY435]|uniref:autotransporter domain-containing protein n=1 Tax=Aminobacter sp. HY435 TaxID=2970917 RepID=UPI0022B97036|nr:autotransporter serine protease [Aminobacter sp. HY435]
MHRKLRLLSRMATLCLSTSLLTIGAASASGDPRDPNFWRTPEFLAQYGLDWIGAQYAYARGLDGSGVTIGIVDSGIDMGHPEFAGSNFNGLGWDGVSWATDLMGHGTPVAAVIAAKRDGKGMHGVAPGATVLEAIYTDRNGEIDSAAVPGAIDWLLGKKAPFILFELGYTFAVTETSAEEYELYVGARLAAFRRAFDAGTLMIVPTHNQGLDNANPESGLPYLFPELEAGWLAVTGYAYEDANKCGVAKNWCLAAPASQIYTAVPGGGYDEVWGTSFAGPHVAGAAALVQQLFPYMTPFQIKQVLLGTANDIGDPGVDDVYGYGFLDVSVAILGPGKFDWGDFRAVQTTADSRWFNDITGAGGLIKAGGGVLSLFGNSTYSGATRVEDGTLAIAGSIASDTYVEAGGLLSGDGTIVGDVDNRGAIYAGWGGDGGTLALDGHYAQSDGATMTVMLGARDGTSLLDVSGTALIDGQLDVRLASGGYTGDMRHTILAAGDVTGMFDTLLASFAFLDVGVDYDPGHVYLDVNRNSTAFTALAASDNGAAAAAAIEQLGIGNSVFDGVIGLSASGAPAAFNQLTGEMHAALAGSLIETGSFVRDAATARLRSAFADVSSPALPIMAYGPGGMELAAADTDRFAVWSQALGGWGWSNGKTSDIERSTGGLLFGGDAEVGDDWRLGLIGGYSNSSFHADGASGSSQNIHLGAYGGAAFGALNLRAAVGYTWHDIGTARDVSLPAQSVLRAAYDAATAQASGEIGYRMEAGRFRLEPFGGLGYASIRTEGFSERGGAAALSSAASTFDTTTSTLGLHTATDVSFGSISATARGTLGWRHAFGDVTPTSSMAFAGGAAFDIEGLPIARDALILEAGIDATLSATARLGLSYAGQLAGTAQDHAFSADLSIRF